LIKSFVRNLGIYSQRIMGDSEVKMNDLGMEMKAESKRQNWKKRLRAHGWRSHVYQRKDNALCSDLKNEVDGESRKVGRLTRKHDRE
jgi:hypothetical protein